MYDSDIEMLIGLLVIGFPVVFGYLIPTIADYFIKRYEKNHKCKHLHTVWWWVLLDVWSMWLQITLGKKLYFQN